MKTTIIISGGSGNDALVKGLKAFYKDKNLSIKVIVNAYDNGKSTGVCRKVTDTLGVSDIRKNHSRMYVSEYGDKVDKNLLEFYEKRFDFTKNKEELEISKLLDKWNLKEYKKYVSNFFKNPKANEFNYKDFSVSNIVYSQMYKELGYEKTNKHFCDKMGIDDFVVLNSFDNIFIKALTESGTIIDDEGKTVFWNNKNDRIISTIYEGKIKYGLNPKAIELIDNSDLIIISTGTFWSSIQPTIEYMNFYDYINKAKCQKIWIINNEDDGDSFGFTNLDFIHYMERTGLDLSNVKILLNKSAKETLKLTIPNYNFIVKDMGNIKGKHEPEKMVKSVIDIYYDK
ncbi:2-phospho-L-lactate transferase CofD family protein [Mycoplasmopsis fermentans]|uniref:2-phospho-L-lactate transferase CofD family protein n=1 Tax=Mycoplasmopsis fermentans TaxID=2115 RepID=UPI000F01F3F2|nr:2-phospho-L-lactate transferase CofD family protein [Mycoplasmopsis fermentans]RMX36403.1 hypothetical protein MFI1_0037 [Mycoplasmopsis fermentans MF-I1]